MRLIDADKLKECFSEPTFKNEMVKIIIDRQPTVEVIAEIIDCEEPDGTINSAKLIERIRNMEVQE